MHGLPDCTLHYAELQFESSEIEGHTTIMQQQTSSNLNSSIKSLMNMPTNQTAFYSNHVSPFRLTKTDTGYEQPENSDQLPKPSRIQILCSASENVQVQSTNAENTKFESTV